MNTASSTAGGGFQEIKLSRLQRFMQWLGYNKTHIIEQPKDGDVPGAGWMHTDVRLYVTFLDRLRILFSGKVKVSITQYINTPTPSDIAVETRLTIYSPEAGIST